MHPSPQVKFSTFFQLATVRLDNRPANRTMVYRGFAKDSCMLTFTTDRRSDIAHVLLHTTVLHLAVAGDMHEAKQCMWATVTKLQASALLAGVPSCTMSRRIPGARCAGTSQRAGSSTAWAAS